MPRLIKDGTIVEDSWLPPQPDAEQIQAGHLATLAQWQLLPDKAGSAVQLEPDDDLSPLLDHLNDIALVAIHFTAFMDGRGFTQARELRERGYKGELRACGAFIRDQMTYLRRVGVNAFQPADDSGLEASLQSLADFNEFYQASVDQPQPLFRRRK